MKVLCQIDIPEWTDQGHQQKHTASLSQSLGNSAPLHGVPIAWQRGESAELIAYAGFVFFSFNVIN